MSYKTQARLAQDDHLLIRVTACAATQSIPNPMSWAYERAWQLSATPGWDDAYSYAINVGVTDPGNDEGVITDGSILATVQAIIGSEPAIATREGRTTPREANPLVDSEASAAPEAPAE